MFSSQAEPLESFRFVCGNTIAKQQNHLQCLLRISVTTDGGSLKQPHRFLSVAWDALPIPMHLTDPILRLGITLLCQRRQLVQSHLVVPSLVSGEASFEILSSSQKRATKYDDAQNPELRFHVVIPPEALFDESVPMAVRPSRPSCEPSRQREARGKALATHSISTHSVSTQSL